MSMFGSSTPAIQPIDNSAELKAEDERKRLEVERAAYAESKSAGRRSTMAAGLTDEAADQYGRGLLNKTRRESAAAVLGA